MSGDSPSNFWKRIGLKGEDRLRCIRAVQDRYIGCRVQEFGEQGYCSFTLLVSPPGNISIAGNKSRQLECDRVRERGSRESRIVQIRPAQHALDLNIAQSAKATYPSLAPAIRGLDLGLPRHLCAYEMERMCGTPLSRLLPRAQVLDSALQRKQERLVETFAAFIAHGLQPCSKPELRIRNVRADSPMGDVSEMLSQCTGKVGSSILRRLGRLSEELPDSNLRRRAKSTLERVKAVDAYPVVLNHGDLIPSNVLIDEETWGITGLVDWAEAEYLPFGTCLYGLEHLLGYLTPVSQPLSQLRDDSSNLSHTPTFTYFGNAPRLRDLFWARLFDAIPDFKMRQEDVRIMRDMGVLLWYGYAWDDGAINRVVNEMDDAVEVTCLRRFLDAA